MNRTIMALWSILPVRLGDLLASVVNAQAPEKEKVGIASAGKWLSLVDCGKHDESWSEAAGYLKNAVTQEEWMQLLKGAREPLGNLISRKVKRKMYATTLPGVPDGEYVVIQFETSFENKKSAVETVTPMLDKDGKWKVAGYLIR